MAEHTEEGAMGVILNRPAETTVAEAVPDLEWLLGEGEAAVWVGGPVAPTSVIVLAEFDDPENAALIVDGELGFVPAEIDDRDAFAAGVRRTRIFAGHAGWGPGQLEAELEEDSWILEPAQSGDVFTAEPNALWSRVLRRKGRDSVLPAPMPMAPSLNWGAAPRSTERLTQCPPQPPLVLRPRDEPRAEAHRVLRRHLDVGEVVAALGEMVQRARDQDVAGVRDPVRHRLEHRRTADQHRDHPGAQASARVDLERVGVPGAVQLAVQAREPRCDPDAVARRARPGAGVEDGVEGRVRAQGPAGAGAEAAADAAAQARPGALVELEERPLVGRVERQRPERLLGVVHREEAGRVQRERLVDVGAQAAEGRRRASVPSAAASAMRPDPDMNEVLPGVLHWTAHHEGIDARVHSHFAVESAALIDPRVPDGGVEEIARYGRPDRILLSNRHHLRHSERFAAAFGCPIRCHEAGLWEV